MAGLAVVFHFLSAPKVLGYICPGSERPTECAECGWSTTDALASWRVAQPAINLHLDDTPLGYRPTRGWPVAFGLSYRQRDVVAEDPAVFGVGTNWSTSFRVYLLDATSVQSGLFRLHRGGPGLVDYYVDHYVGTPQFYDGSVLTTPDGGLTYQIEHPDGAKDVFGKSFVNSQGQTLFFLTARLDPASNTLTFTYATNQNMVRCPV